MELVIPLRTPKLLTKSIGFRLTLWYSSIFILRSLLLFILAYFLLSTSLKQQDKEAIQLKMEEFSSLFQEGGLDSLERKISVENEGFSC